MLGNPLRKTTILSLNLTSNEKCDNIMAISQFSHSKFPLSFNVKYYLFEADTTVTPTNV